MKKIIGFVAVVALMLVAASCGGGNSPKDVAEKAVKCIQNNDYEGYVDLMLITADEGEDLEAKKQAVTGMVQSKAATTLAKMGGIKSYEITSVLKGVSKCSKQESDASRRSYRELTDKCQVSEIQAVVS